MAKRKISDVAGLAALAAVAGVTADAEDAGVAEAGRTLADTNRDTIATAVRYLLQVLAESAEGNTVEVRVPPFGAVQCIPGPRHTRGTPPNVVEMDAETWLGLATGTLTWSGALAAGRVHASGQRADLSGYVPVFAARPATS